MIRFRSVRRNVSDNVNCSLRSKSRWLAKLRPCVRLKSKLLKKSALAI